MAMDAVPLEQLQDPTSAYYSEIKQNGLSRNGSARLKTIRDAALGVGIRGGLKAKTDETSKALNEVNRQLDVAYDFRPYLIQGRVLPAVIVESRDIYTQGSDTALRLAGRTYKIEQQARFTSRAPTWKEYLLVTYDVAMPSPSLLPKTPEETEVWKTAVAEGWEIGVKDAERIFKSNFDRLDRDYVGILRFHKLVVTGQITMPIIATATMAVNGSKREMALDEMLLRITVLPEFNLKPVYWKAAPGSVFNTVVASNPSPGPAASATQPGAPVIDAAPAHVPENANPAEPSANPTEKGESNGPNTR
jgi:defect-in-organelle-trafficking protein DotC